MRFLRFNLKGSLDFQIFHSFSPGAHDGHSIYYPFSLNSSELRGTSLVKLSRPVTSDSDDVLSWHADLCRRDHILQQCLPSAIFCQGFVLLTTFTQNEIRCDIFLVIRDREGRVARFQCWYSTLHLTSLQWLDRCLLLFLCVCVRRCRWKQTWNMALLRKSKWSHAQWSQVIHIYMCPLLLRMGSNTSRLSYTRGLTLMAALEPASLGVKRED